MTQPSFLDCIKSSTLLLDGAMGTMIQNLNLTAQAYGGEKFEMLADLLSLSRKKEIEAIHYAYFEAGANAVETNTFGANKLRLEEFDFTQLDVSNFPKELDTNDIHSIVSLLNVRSVQIAKQALTKYKQTKEYDGRPLFILGSVGPSNYILSSTQADLKKATFAQIEENFFEQTLALTQAGADAILLETQQDALELKAAIFGVKKAFEASNITLPIIAQVTVNEFACMQLFNTELLAAITTVASLPIDMFGINCSIGPKQMVSFVKLISEYCPIPFSVIPNAGMPKLENGQTIFDVPKEEFSEIVASFSTKYGASLVGGCCGSSPEYIRLLALQLKDTVRAERHIKETVFVSGPQYAIPLDSTDSLIQIGERLNIRGSKKVRLATENDDAIDHSVLEEVIQEQINDLGIKIIDVCMDSNQIDTTKTLCSVIENQTYDFTGAMCIDSFDIEALAQAISYYPGRPIINSISLEEASKGVSKIDAILQETAQHQPIYIALTTDGEGPAITAKKKVELAEQIITKAKEYHINPNQILIDVNAFPIGTETDPNMNFAVESLNAIGPIKALAKGLKTTIGIGNLTNGLAKKPYMRKILTSVFLHEATQRGLDAAIINPNHYAPVSSFEPNDVTLANKVIFEKDMDAFAELESIALAKKGVKLTKKNTYEELSIEESIRQKIKDGYKHKQEGVVEYNNKQYSYSDSIIISVVSLLHKDIKPLDIINDHLMLAMNELGDDFALGNVSLPHLLKSADIMKQIMSFLEEIMKEGKDSKQTKKAKIVLGTMYQDVHSIGKDLVKTLFQNYGYEVIDLGVQVEPERFVQTAIKESADAIGMSALLVQTSNHMTKVAQLCRENNLNIPLLIGGAPVNHKHAAFVSRELSEDKTINPLVFYSASAMTGVTIMNQFCNETTRKKLLEANKIKLESTQQRNTKQKEKTSLLLENLPKRTVDTTLLPKIKIQLPWEQNYQFKPTQFIDFINRKNLFSLNWRYGSQATRKSRQITDAELEEKLLSLLTLAEQKNYFSIQGICGIFPCRKEGSSLFIYNEKTKKEEEIPFSYIIGGTKQDIFTVADYFAKQGYIGIQLATAGDLTQAIKELEADMETVWLLQGLANRIAEDTANFLTKQLEKTCNSNHAFLRYSPGYPSMPNLEYNHLIVSIFQNPINVETTEGGEFNPTCSTGAFVSFHPNASYS